MLYEDDRVSDNTVKLLDTVKLLAGVVNCLG